MRFHVEGPDGNLLPLDLDPEDPIMNVVAEVEGETYLQLGDFVLQKRGTTLNPTHSLREGGVEEGDVIQVVTEERSVRFQVRVPGGQRLQFELDPEVPAMVLLIEVGEEAGLEIGDFAVQRHGCPLSVVHSLEENGVEDGDLLHVLTCSSSRERALG